MFDLTAHGYHDKQWFIDLVVEKGKDKHRAPWIFLSSTSEDQTYHSNGELLNMAKIDQVVG